MAINPNYHDLEHYKNQSVYNPFGVTDANYIYISHLDSIDGRDLRYWKLPCLPEELTDTMESTFAQNQALGRTAPVFTYSHSGPRTVQISFEFHRDMMEDLNDGFSNVQVEPGEDYVDSLIKALQSIALPRYNTNNKAIEPPLVGLRIMNEIFVKGVVSGSIGVTYKKPILSNGKFAIVRLAITISEVDPYDSTSVYKNGSFRGLLNTMRGHMGG